MNTLKSFLLKRPVISVISLSVVWLALTMLFGGITSVVFNQEFGNTTTSFSAHLIVVMCVFILLWRFNWLKVTGISRIGDFRIWLLTIAATIYMTTASLYSFYGKFLFDISDLKDLTAIVEIIMAQIAVGLNEEFLFRGILLYILIQSWVGKKWGKVGSVILMSGIFALFHVMYVSTSGTSALLLALEAFVISIWWASLVLAGRSIWPAFFAHFIVNAVISIQGISQSIIQPEIYSYSKLFLFSLPLGVIALRMILKINNESGIS
jgi:membrane protease YdiL (CAAX protease family)